MRAIGIVLGLGLLGALGCLPRLSTEGAGCPCLDGYFCCERTNTCVVDDDGLGDKRCRCGDGQIDPDEDCDGERFNGRTCGDFVDGTQGSLTCDPELCTVEIDGCWKCRDDRISGPEVCEPNIPWRAPACPLDNGFEATCADDCLSYSLSGCRPLDVLFVIDDSGSMQEEQQQLAQDFVKEGCPITDLANVPDAYRSPSAATLESLYAECGYGQLLATLSDSVRIGIITTDVGFCDDRYGFESSLATYVRRPQRGCLQRADGDARRMVDLDHPGASVWFADAMRSVGIAGTALEEGLEAVEVFFDEEAARGPGCEGDLAHFNRPEANLLILFVTDEDDCSHSTSEELVDDSLDTSCEAYSSYPGLDVAQPQPWGELCYTRPDLLTPIDHFVEVFRGLRSDPNAVRVGVIAGVEGSEEGGFTAVGCYEPPTGLVSTDCHATHGLSNLCPDGWDADAQMPCCTADPANRYVELAEALGSRAAVHSICDRSNLNGELTRMIVELAR